MSDVNEDLCPCCNNLCTSHRRAMHSYKEYECSECGYFAIHDRFNVDSIKKRSLMYHYLLHKRKSDRLIFFVSDKNKHSDKDSADVYHVDEKILNNINPRTLNNKIDMILLNLSKKIKVLGDTFIVPDLDDEPSKYYTFFMVDDSCSKESLWKQVEAVIDIMIEYDLLKHVESLGDNENSYTFTATGWNRLSELQEENLPHAFIAMHFADEMKEAREKISQAILDSGYIPMIIDEKEHNNQIVPEIFYEIERSTFIVADLTKHRNGVYYEAGYAQALNKEVIITCKKSDSSNTHFDISQKNAIHWESKEQLYDRLLRRIEATIGKR